MGDAGSAVALDDLRGLRGEGAPVEERARDVEHVVDLDQDGAAGDELQHGAEPGRGRGADDAAHARAGEGVALQVLDREAHLGQLGHAAGVVEARGSEHQVLGVDVGRQGVDVDGDRLERRLAATGLGVATVVDRARERVGVLLVAGGDPVELRVGDERQGVEVDRGEPLGEATAGLDAPEGLQVDLAGEDVVVTLEVLVLEHVEAGLGGLRHFCRSVLSHVREG